MPETPPKDIRIETARSHEALRAIEDLAREIWLEHYTPIIGHAQAEYMLERFQSREAMARQIANGISYWLVLAENTPVGYLAYERKAEGIFLSKLYVKASERGRGIARHGLRHLIATERPARITLTVNRHNTLALAAYQAFGFVRAGEVKTDIGKGFFMDDFVLEWRPPPDPP